MEAGPPTHSAAPRSSWDVERSAESFSRIEACSFSRGCSPKEGSQQFGNPRCSTYRSVLITRLAAKPNLNRHGDICHPYLSCLG